MSQLMTIQEVADLLKVSTKTVIRWSDAQKIPTVALPGMRRFDPKEIERWLNSRTVRAKSKPVI